MRSINEIINELVEIEMDLNSHIKVPSDYDTVFEFYSSSAAKDSYINSFLKDILTVEEQEKYNLYDIQASVIEQIAEKINLQ